MTAAARARRDSSERTSAPATAPEPPPDGDLLTTGEMARLSKNTLRTVRFYEEAGVLTPVGRTGGGHRLFERTQLDRLMLVSDMREAGFSLEDIRQLLGVKAKAATGGAAADAAGVALRKHVTEIQAKIAVLQRLAADLERAAEATKLCAGCKEAVLFPEHCDDCGRLGPSESQARSMRVLWSLGRGKRPGQNGAAK